jgi:hypothetical protein
VTDRATVAVPHRERSHVLTLLGLRDWSQNLMGGGSGTGSTEHPSTTLRSDETYAYAVTDRATVAVPHRERSHVLTLLGRAAGDQASGV